jgi:hypothetical protein
MNVLKWSFRVFIFVVLLRAFAKDTVVYQAIAPITEPVFEACFEQLASLWENSAEQNSSNNNHIKTDNNSKKEDEVVVEEQDEAVYETVQEPDEILPCESKIKHVTHQQNWQDLQSRTFKAKFTVLPQVACQAESFREKLPEPISDGSVRDYYGKVYLQLTKDNKDKMQKIYKTFDKVREKNKLNQKQFAEMVVSYVQSIPYVLVHPESCTKARKWGGFFEEYHDEGKECLPEIRFGLTSPSEFIYNLKGDCDTRTVFLYTVLAHFGYDVAIFVSQTHCMLGINMPAHGDFMKYKGKKYYFWETTAKGYAMGVIAPNFKNEVWHIALVRPSKI